MRLLREGLLVAAKRDALAENLNALASDFKGLLETLVHDPKEQARKERRWRALLAITGVIYTIGARRAAAKTWSILTGELPPARTPRQDAARGPAQGEADVTPAAQREDEPAPAA